MPDNDPPLFAVPGGAPPTSPVADAPAPPSPYLAPPSVPRPTPPSVHLGWVVAAWVLSWPIAIPAHLARERALAALARRDEATAAREARRARGFALAGVWVGSAWTVLLLVGVGVGLVWTTARVADGTLALPGATSAESAGEGAASDDALRYVYPSEVAVGDCWLSMDVDYEAEEYTIGLLPCGGDHDVEVFADVHLPAGSDYPGDDVVNRLAQDYCQEEYAALPGARDDMFVWPYAPAYEEYWENDSWRLVSCMAETNWGTVTGNVRQEGDLEDLASFASLDPGVCFDSDGEVPDPASGVLVPVRPCDRFHLSEAFARIPLPADAYPGDTRKERLGDEACAAERERLGVAPRDEALTVGSVSPTREHWTSSSFDVVLCYVESTDGLLRGSVLD